MNSGVVQELGNNKVVLVDNCSQFCDVAKARGISSVLFDCMSADECELAMIQDFVKLALTITS